MGSHHYFGIVQYNHLICSLGGKQVRVEPRTFLEAWARIHGRRGDGGGRSSKVFECRFIRPAGTGNYFITNSRQSIAGLLSRRPSRTARTSALRFIGGERVRTEHGTVHEPENPCEGNRLFRPAIFPPGRMPGSTAGRMPAATLQRMVNSSGSGL